MAFGTPLSAFAGVLVNLWLTQRVARQADHRARREELLRNLRWAAELAASDDELRRRVGVGQLAAWGRSEVLDDADQAFVDTALRDVLGEAAPPTPATGAADREIVVLEHPVRGSPDVRSTTDEGDREGKP